MPVVTIELSIGIPSDAVLYSVLGYGGAFNGGVKCKPGATVDLDKAGSASMTVGGLAWSTTNQYEETDALAVAGKPDWFRLIRNGAAPINSKQLQRTSANLDIQFIQFAGATHAVKLIVVGPNPLLTLAPAIDAEIVVGLRKAGGSTEYTVQGGRTMDSRITP